MRAWASGGSDEGVGTDGYDGRGHAGLSGVQEMGFSISHPALHPIPIPVP